MGRAPISPDLDFRLAAGLGANHGIVRGVVGLQRRSEEDALLGRSFEAQAQQLSLALYSSVLLVALDSERAGRPPVGSVLASDGLHRNNGRRAIELSRVFVDPDYEDPEGLAATLVALSCQGIRRRLRPVRARVHPNQEHVSAALQKVGFSKHPPIFEGIDEGVYKIGAGQLAIHGAKRLPGGKTRLRQASKDLRWD